MFVVFRVTKIIFIVTMWDTDTGSFPYGICDRDVTSQTLWRSDGSGWVGGGGGGGAGVDG